MDPGPEIMQLPRTLSWQEQTLTLLDQTRLPHETCYVSCTEIEQVHEAIASLRVRGAPAIGIAAAYGVLLPWLEEVSLEVLAERAAYLNSARPTAVNLSWATGRMLGVAQEISEKGVVQSAVLQNEAVQIHQEDAKSCRAIGQHGATLLRDLPRILTHCNAGALAVSEWGTALAPIYTLHEQGVPVHVYVDETRPLMQGARLTAFELQQSGVSCELICDNMAASLMSRGLVDAVIVGADRVAANGDTANKIGTLAVAIVADYFSVPFFVACPVSTIDYKTGTGEDIDIEQRATREVTHLGDQLIAPPGIRAQNPAFDVTPAGLITALITEKGVLHKPDASSLGSWR